MLESPGAVPNPEGTLGCRTCDKACDRVAIYIDSPRATLKKAVCPIEILTPERGNGLADAREWRCAPALGKDATWRQLRWNNHHPLRSPSR